MAEKRGDIEKLTYDFNTAGCLEVKLASTGMWHRTTAREFRSFDGPRRITEPEYVKLGVVDVPMVTWEYNGPVFAFSTNKRVRKTNSGTYIREIKNKK